MSEYIKREDCIALLYEDGHYGYLDRVDIDRIPAADVAEVRHGHWIMHDDPILGLTCECSECHIETCGDTNYCPACGAKMDEVVCDEIQKPKNRRNILGDTG